MSAANHSDILVTEQSYAALNAQMEAKTAELLSEVDNVLRNQEERLLASVHDDFNDGEVGGCI